MQTHGFGFLKSRTRFLMLSILLVATAAHAQPSGQTVRVPLTIDYLALSAALKQQLYTDNGRAPLWNGSDQCQYLYAESPAFSRRNGQLSLETRASLSIGVAMGSQCISPIMWNGIIEAQTAPYIAPNLMLRLRVTDLNLYNQQHEKTLIAGQGFDQVKQYFIPRIETFSFDLNPAARQLQDLAQASASPEVAERVRQTLATLRAEPQVLAEDRGVRVTLDLTLPAFATPGATAPAPAQLTPAEMAGFEKLIDQWDAFLVFAIKQLADVQNDPKLRADLMDLLLDSRHRLVEALANPPSGGPDPVRILFLREWQRLGEIIGDAARRGTLGNHSLEFLSFISAGDALFALDEAAPALGMRISAGDLRRLAKIMAPHSTKDPLTFNFEEDPELRKMFHTEGALESEGPLDTEPIEIGAPERGASASPAATPAFSPEPGVAPSPRSPAPSPTSWLEFIFAPSEADAADLPPAKSALVKKLEELAKRLRRVVVQEQNASEYRVNVAQLLNYGAQREIGDERIDQGYRVIYMTLVESAAWQESCWRQFVRRGNRVVYLESSTHDIGLMQVNKYVWRGFYSLPRLEWDVLYNASAGMEILARLLRDTADKRGAFTPGKPNELARSVYCAYNGGPGSYRRWRGRESHLQRTVDDSFWEKYQAVMRGQQIDIMSCAAKWGREH